jgi:thymidylate kinase
LAYFIVIGGFAGAGKSTLARKLGQTFSLPYYDTDLVSKAIADSSEFEGGSPAGVAFDVVWMLAEAYLRNECSLIFDQNMGRPWQWRRIREICEKVPGATQVTFILDCPFEVCIERCETRTGHPEIGSVDFRAHKFKWDYLRDNELPEAIRVDASRPADVVYHEVAAHLITRFPRVDVETPPG